MNRLRPHLNASIARFSRTVFLLKDDAEFRQPVLLTLLITSDDAIRELNRQYRQQDKPTDVLSFPLLDKPLVDAPADQLWMTPEGEEENQAVQERSRPVFMTPPELP